ncbi:hypothetical protein [Hymenobacter sp. CRA2]|uniref:hypothetical protein n=1 Tax=Hymenobacter sp. CRA2 TaxID=1955620 RepID=UPI00098EDB5E|nr:hypothetical protein [Hymenobacter sp. CRA2]OON70283.1 hypothetical protein B0919_06010 [Hymenobacter sp. CRA2]
MRRLLAHRWTAWGKAPQWWRPYGAGALLILGLYLLYLPFSGFDALAFDAKQYWTVAAYFHKGGSTSLFSYDNSMRGYFYPLLLYPLHAVHYFTHIPPIVFGRLQGAVSAALGFGLIGPGLWQAVRGDASPISWRRRLAFAGLGFLFWRDHFNFTLSDFPALWLLGAGLWLLYGSGRLRWLLLAGACVAAATNVRPIYLASVPFVLGVLLTRPALPGRRAVLLQLLALAVGAALVLGPQLIINQRHFQRDTPLVLAQDQNIPPGTLYPAKLWFGLIHQRYETNIGLDYPEPVMFFVDQEGRRLVQAEQPMWFTSVPEFLGFARRHPALVARQSLLHLFNGLDVQYTTPYVAQVYTPTLGLVVLNFTALFAAGLVLLRARWRRRPLHEWLTLAVLLVPCAFMVPVSMECRFLLPLHLLLYAALCFAWPAHWRWLACSRQQRLILTGAYVLFLALCLSLSSYTQAHLELGGRTLLGRKLPPTSMRPLSAAE